MFKWPGDLGRLMRGTVRGLGVVLLLATLFGLLDLGMRTLGTSAVSCHTVIRDNNLRATRGCQTQRSSDVVVYLPGVTATASKASAPVIDTWLDVGDVQLVDYFGNRFEPGMVVPAVARILEWDAQHYDHLYVYGESLGCYIAADALAANRNGGTVLGHRLRLLLGDCPSGPHTMKPDSILAELLYSGPLLDSLADGFAGIAHWLTRTTGPGDVLLWSWSSSNAPADAFEPGVEVQSVQAQQRLDSSGYSLAAFTDQVRYMRGGIPSLAALAGSSVAYVMVQPAADESVAQPQAMVDWVNSAASFGVRVQQIPLSFPSGHMDYCGWPTSWNRVFSSSFALLSGR